ncbi:MAG: hypothetical protein JKY84_12770 [Emcibacteraceae bacterium]|nr:hypothetical protein [Emcibacteraceae bacterium]
MMRYMFTILILFAFSSTTVSLVAQETSRKNDVSERIIIVTSEQCKLLTPHIPDADVNYKADVDVRGNALVPADINSGMEQMFGENGYSFYMTHDALKDMNANESSGLTGNEEGKIILGQVTVKDGDVLWNGVSLKERDRNRIYMLCDQERKRRPIIKR